MQLEPALIEYINAMACLETGEFLYKKYWLITIHENEMLSRPIDSLPDGTKLCVLDCREPGLSKPAIATFRLENLAKHSLAAYLESL
ncbi:hypothetical protein [Ferrimonas kyonanensis]|uniref:hypothetical protein n=1 Tax=Ferrimonas kyonanensis TaxID=364763 RepID=UPI0004898980|nr:hypothetical protein [Ferrimonas kyonanensis]